jgi:hypothetical protein
MSYFGLVEYLRKREVYTEEIGKAISEYNKKQEERKAKRPDDVFTWGKYKGKKLADVFSFDVSYCKWAITQKYTSNAIKRNLKKLFDANGARPIPVERVSSATSGTGVKEVVEKNTSVPPNET